MPPSICPASKTDEAKSVWVRLSPPSRRCRLAAPEPTTLRGAIVHKPTSNIPKHCRTVPRSPFPPPPLLRHRPPGPRSAGLRIPKGPRGRRHYAYPFSKAVHHAAGSFPSPGTNTAVSTSDARGSTRSDCLLASRTATSLASACSFCGVLTCCRHGCFVGGAVVHRGGRGRWGRNKNLCTAWCWCWCGEGAGVGTRGGVRVAGRTVCWCANGPSDK